jgi:hypothetical protein
MIQVQACDNHSSERGLNMYHMSRLPGHRPTSLSLPFRCVRIKKAQSSESKLGSRGLFVASSGHLHPVKGKWEIQGQVTLRAYYRSRHFAPRLSFSIGPSQHQSDMRRQIRRNDRGRQSPSPSEMGNRLSLAPGSSAMREAYARTASIILLPLLVAFLMYQGYRCPPSAVRHLQSGHRNCSGDRHHEFREIHALQSATMT